MMQLGLIDHLRREESKCGCDPSRGMDAVAYLPHVLRRCRGVEKGCGFEVVSEECCTTDPIVRRAFVTPLVLNRFKRLAAVQKD